MRSLLRAYIVCTRGGASSRYGDTGGEQSHCEYSRKEAQGKVTKKDNFSSSKDELHPTMKGSVKNKGIAILHTFRATLAFSEMT